MTRLRDDTAVFNERVKFAAGFLNAIGLGLIGFAILRPLTETLSLSGISAALWAITGLVFHGLGHYILGYIKKDGSDDRL